MNQASSSVTLNTSSSPITYGEPVTFTATISPSAATGTVTFKDSGVDITGCISPPVSGGTATCAIGVLGGGSYSITAVYSGDTNHTGSTSNLVTQVVNKASSSVTLNTSSSLITYGEPVTFTATVSPSAATGTVTFKDNGADITGCINPAPCRAARRPAPPAPWVGVTTASRQCTAGIPIMPSARRIPSRRECTGRAAALPSTLRQSKRLWRASHLHRNDQSFGCHRISGVFGGQRYGDL